VVQAFKSANDQNLWVADQGVFFHRTDDEPTCKDED